MIDFSEVYSSVSEVLEGFLDSLAFTFLVISILERPTGMIFLKFGFMMGAFYTLKRLFDVYPYFVEFSDSLVGRLRR